MARNKAFVCFCVDGPTDVDVLRAPFEDLFDEIGGNDINIDFRYATFQGENHGDITTLKGVTPENIEKMIYKYYFKAQDKGSELGWKDLTYIIHIIDLDGAYVQGGDQIREFTPDEKELADSLMTGNKVKTTLYFDDHIAVRQDEKSLNQNCVFLMEERNRRKRKAIEQLLTLETITVGNKTVKYKLYYFSCNLDHYLYGKANLTAAQKMQMASAFADRNADAASLACFFENSEYSSCEDYAQSWKKMWKGCASLGRGTNVNLLIREIQNSDLTDWL